MSANPNTFRAGPVVIGANGASSALSELGAGAAQERKELQSLLAFSALHGQVRRKVTTSFNPTKSSSAIALEPQESFSVDEMLDLVAMRAQQITGADGLAIALGDELGIVVRAHAGEVRPDVGQYIDMEASFSSRCLQRGEVLTCDDTELEAGVNRSACRALGVRSLLAVPIRGQHGTVGILEAFSKEASAFDDSDCRQISALADVLTAALSPEEEERFAQLAQAALAALQPPPPLKKPVANSRLWTSFTDPDGLSEAMPLHLAPSRSMPTAIPSSVAARQFDVETQLSLREMAVPTPGTQDDQRPGSAWLVLAFIVIAAAFIAGVGWRISNSLKVGGAGTPISLTAQPSTRSVEAKPGPPADSAGGVHVPAPAVGSSANAVTAEPSKGAVTGIQHVSNSTSTTVLIACDEKLQYEVHRLTEPDRIYLDLANAKVAPGLASKPIPVGDAFLHQIRVAQTAIGVTRVVLETNGRVAFSVSREPVGLKVELTRKGPSQH